MQGHAYHIEKRHIRETVDLADAYVFVWGDGEYGKLGQQARPPPRLTMNLTIKCLQPWRTPTNPHN